MAEEYEPFETPGCPVAHAAARRKTDLDPDGGGPAIERRGDVWHLRSYDAVRRVLRGGDAVRQSLLDGNPPTILRLGLRPPVIFQDGEEHRRQRTALARFFTPRRVSEAYQALMDDLSDELIAELVRDGAADLSRLSARLAGRVAAEVIGLTDSRRPGLGRRLDALLSFGPPPSGLRRALRFAGNGADMLRFYLLDVRPAIAARRRERREDVVSHLLDLGYRDPEIFIECITYAVAGMTTTREFIAVAAWHLLEDDALRRDYLAADEPERHRTLHEILRLEPVASRLYRRTVEPIELEHDGNTVRIPAGVTLHLHLRAANLDPAAVGNDPLALCPHRDLARGVQPPVVSFGDGAHRCPGAFVAIQESDTFLRRLLRLPLRISRPPRVTWNGQLQAYEVRDFEIALDGGAELS